MENKTEQPKPTKKKGLKKALTAWIAVLLVIAILAGGVIGYLNYVNNAPLPKIDGTLKVNGLYTGVEVLRDASGIPHIYAANLHDLFFTQGYVQAQDRWWQMDFFRHVCAGNIEDLTGKKQSLVSTDMYFRTMGWRKVAEQEYNNLTGDQRLPLDAFTQGINAYISNRTPQELSVNYSILALTGAKPKIEPWTPVDCLAFSKLMAWDLGYSGDEEVLRSQLYSTLGQEMADKWETPPWSYGERPTIVQQEDIAAMEISASPAPVQPPASAGKTAGQPGIAFESFQPDLTWLSGGHSGIGSNNWVVSGNLTQSGRPLLANDPHLGIQMPSIWYEIDLHCTDDGNGQPFDVTGFTFTLSPGVIIGHNNNIAWGVTNIYPDVNDHYQIKVNPDNPLQYEWNGSWRDMTVRNETISFADGAAPINFKVRETHLGPIVNDNKYDADTGTFTGFNNKDPLALRWTALETGTITIAIMGINKAKNFEEFRNAVKYWDCPAQNMIFADTAGNIGYQMPGRVPIRSKNHNSLLPVPGWTDEYEWKGYIPFDLLPRVYNPERGFIVTANQAVVPLSYYDFLNRQLGPQDSYNLGYEWNYGYRAERINRLIKDLAPHSIATFQKIQGDSRQVSVDEVMPYLANIKFSDPDLASAKDWLVNWDRTFNADSPQAALYSEFWMRLVSNVFPDQLGNAVKPRGDDRDMRAICLLLKNPEDPWWDDVSSKDVKETRDDILARSFKEGYEASVKALGPDRSKWQWGSLHTSTFVSNPLGVSGIRPIESLVNRGPFPTGGTVEAVNNTRWGVDKGTFASQTIPSMRMIVDMSDLSKSVCVNSTGESGNPSSPYYGDMIKSWLGIKYHPMLWTRQQVDAGAEHKLLLTP